MTKAEKIAVIKYLDGLARGKTPTPSYLGICMSLVTEFGSTEASVLCSQHIKTWYKHSGHPLFPIEGDSVKFASSGKWSGNRGKLRRSLCRHIVKKLKAEL